MIRWEVVGDGVERIRAGAGWLYRVRTSTTTALRRKDIEVGRSVVERVTVTYVPRDGR